MFANSRWIAAAALLLSFGTARAGVCPAGAEVLEPAGPDAFTLVCDDPYGATGCWEPPAGACAATNVVTVTVDGSQIYQETWQGSGGNTCTTGYPVVGHTFSTGASHTVVESETAPPSTDTFSVTVLPGPACDADDDQAFDTADNCLGVWNPDQVDTDLDGAGNACDDDDDGDTCSDREDDDATEDKVVIGSRLAINCPEANVAVYGSASDDVDGDGLPACLDDDDDNDGVDDEDDDCPAHAGGRGSLPCQYPPVTCPLQYWWDVCMFGACNELLLRWVAVVNPDPNEVWFDGIDIVGRSLVIGAQREMSLDAVRAVLVDRGTPGPFVLEVWSKDRSGDAEALVATIGRYEAGNVALREGVGNALVLEIDERGVLASIEAMSH